MFIDARSLPADTTIETDLCVIGAGAAGITMARELIDAPFRVTLLEGGGLELDADTQSLNVGTNVGFPYFELGAIRLRYFGGTTNHWAGSCLPLDELDFEMRPWVPHSGWPFGKATLDPYYARAHPVCQLGRYDYSPESWETDQIRRLPLTGDRIITSMHQKSPPTRFGEVYREEVEKARNIQTYLHANVVQIDATPDARAITHLTVATLAGNRFRVAARVFVLATGALENARLLLASTSVQKTGLGNQHDLVGRFFMEHLNVQGGVFLPSDPALRMDLYAPTDDEVQHSAAGEGVGFLAPSPATLRREQMVNVRALFRADHAGHGVLRTSDGLLKIAAGYEAGEIASSPGSLLRHLYGVIADLDDVAIAAYLKLFRSPRTFLLIYHIEQAPNPESRVMLSAERDPLDMPRLQLAWRFTDLERQTLDRASRMVAEECGKAGVGRVRVIPDDPATGWPSVVRRVSGTWHQMGTTRMHTDPRHGVIDSDCRVHGIANLFVAGSSVFPTSGYANPTLTLVALAIRLADHLKQQMSGGL